MKDIPLSAERRSSILPWASSESGRTASGLQGSPLELDSVIGSANRPPPSERIKSGAAGS
jgi:hypothetical protein